jgi:hypothetical protein
VVIVIFWPTSVTYWIDKPVAVDPKMELKIPPPPPIPSLDQSQIK